MRVIIATMKKHFFFKQKTWISLASIAIIIILMASIIVNFLAIFRVGNMMSIHYELDIVAIVIMTLVIAFLVCFVFLSGYTFKEDYFALNLGVMVLKFKYDDVLLMRTNSDKSMFILFMETNEEKADVKDEENNLKANILQIFVSKDNVDAFISNIKKHNQMVPVEIITEEKR